MTEKTRMRIGASVTVLLLACLSAAGLAARDGQPGASTAAVGTTASVPAPDKAASGESLDGDTEEGVDVGDGAKRGVESDDADESAEDDDDHGDGDGEGDD